MGFFDALMETFLDDADRKEKRFEESVMKKFPKKYFDIVKQPHAKKDPERSAARLHDPSYLLVHKPTKEEFKTISKISGLGILIIGLIGFLVHVIDQLLFK